MVAQSGIVGRTAEFSLLGASIERSAQGTPSALLLCGEAGVGKTRLVTEVTEQYAARGHLVLWGRCLRFGADSSPYLPIGQLLTHWHRQADVAERARVLAGAEDLATIAPPLALARPTTAETGHLIQLASSVIDRITDHAPTVLVIDDLQWADTTSLDLLAYLIAGFTPGQRLCVLGTYRDTDLGEGHRLHGWLADMRRLPAVSQTLLPRLALAETEELVAGLRGAAGSVQRAAEIYGKSGGNPYLTELLARTPADHPEIPAHRVEDLRTALLASWHRLSGPARELMQLLAVGGRPVALTVLERLAEVRGLGADKVRPCLAEAATEGMTTTTGADDVWFHHPLLAEVIAANLPAAELVGIHRDYVAVLEAAGDLPAASRAAHLALHHFGGEHPDEAFTWSLRAADAALEVLAFAEESEHLHRACGLWPRVSPQVRDGAGRRTALLARAADSARSAGEYLLAVGLREQAIALVDPDENALEAARLRLPLHHLRVISGLDQGPQVEPNQEVLDLADRCPDSVERSIALAHVAFAEVWNGAAGAAVHAEEAVRLAERLGSDEALAWALGVRSQSRWETPEGLQDSERALALAERSGDRELWGNAAVWHGNCLMSFGRLTAATDCMLDAFRRLVTVGSVHDAMFAQPAYAALLLVELGRWQEARELIREVLSRRLAADPAAQIRGTASILAFRSGETDRARGHMARVRELKPGGWRAGDLLVTAEVHEHWAAREPGKALERIEHLMPIVTAVDDDGADELLLWAARAAADLADRPTERASAVDWLNRIEGLRGDGTPRFVPGSAEDMLHPARRHLFEAERARCHGERSALPDLWQAAAPACADAGLAWEHALCHYRLGQALLASRGGRARASAALRVAHRLAEDLGAAPIVADVEALARQARISLEAVADTAEEPGVSPAWAALTGREREVLGPLVAGRTYAEIAAALFISEKTVSVHVSNILRKTGTTSRIEVSELARKVDWPR